MNSVNIYIFVANASNDLFMLPVSQARHVAYPVIDGEPRDEAVLQHQVTISSPDGWLCIHVLGKPTKLCPITIEPGLYDAGDAVSFAFVEKHP